MSKQVRIDRCKNILAQWQNLSPTEFESWNLVLSDFDGLNYEESRRALKHILYVFDSLNKNDAWQDVTWTALNNIESLLQNIFNTYSQFKVSRDQSMFQNFAQNLDQLAYHLRLLGIVELATGASNFERSTVVINTEIEKLAKTRAEAEGLKIEVQKLIAPAAAGSLSEAFTARKRVLLWGRITWGFIALSVGGYCVIATYEVATAVGVAIGALKEQSQGVDVLWATLLLRSIVLLPLYAAFGFSFAQYKKERDFEEEYAHKAAVATSLPNYGDLTREPAVRDQIVTGATTVIFSAPTSKSQESERPDKVIGFVKELMDSLGKLGPKKGSDS